MGYADYYRREPALPWTESETDRRFRRITLATLAVSVLAGIIVAFLPVPETERREVVEIPPRLAKVILERRKQPPPPPPKPKAEAPRKKKKAPEPRKKKKVAKKKPKPRVDKAAAARRRARQALAWADELADLRQIEVPAVTAGTLQKRAEAPVQAAAQAESILTARAGAASGGIDTRALARTREQTRLSGRKRARVESRIPSSGQRRLAPAGSRGPARTQEEIQLVFDRNKGAIDRIYNRALRRDPTLQGKVVFKITIAPSGRVVRISIVSSELNNPALEKRLLARIKLFNFGAKDVATTTVTYPVVFLPS